MQGKAITKFLFCLKYFLFWIVYFLVARVIFLCYYFEKTVEIGFKDAFLTFVQGIKLDISFTAYLCVVPFLFITFSNFISNVILKRVFKFYNLILIIIISLLLIIDAGLYEAWGVRLDDSFLNYINTPELMLASVSTSHLIFGSLGWILIAFVFIKLYNKIFNKSILSFQRTKSLFILVFLLLTASLILPVRGGLQTVPINQSNVYFSSKMFANHAAINFIWNFFNSLTKKVDGTNPYKYFDNAVAKKISNSARNELLIADVDSILNTKKPNIILILWESLSAKIVGSLDGEKGVTPNLNRLSEEGIFFTNFYSNGDRTDKALPAILSGYYPQPVKRIMRMPNKTRNLPFLPKALEKLGYTTSFSYGGDLNFGNMNTYLRNADFDEVHDGSEFDDKDWNSKWGAFDDVFMKRFAEKLAKKEDKPFFEVALTLSSHEPYEIKGDYKFGNDGESNLYRSAHHYTDKVIGDFIAFAKKQDWYKNTLIVIMSDHGHSSPTPDNPYFGIKKFHMPMLWLGGALNKTGLKVDHISSQVDFSYTLLDLLGGDNSEFKFSKHIFNSSENQYAQYMFNTGFGTHTKNGTFIYDYVSKKPILNTGKTQKLDSLGKAITQLSYEDFLAR